MARLILTIVMIVFGKSDGDAVGCCSGGLTGNNLRELLFSGLSSGVAVAHQWTGNDLRPQFPSLIAPPLNFSVVNFFPRSRPLLRPCCPFLAPWH